MHNSIKWKRVAVGEKPAMVLSNRLRCYQHNYCNIYYLKPHWYNIISWIVLAITIIKFRLTAKPIIIYNDNMLEEIKKSIIEGCKSV